MISFPNAKINIGLRIIEKREDGFHNLESIFYPVKGLYDCLEIIESADLRFENSGLYIDAPMEKNLCVKAWKLLHEKYAIPPVHIWLHKVIPFGAGLGGGSADASFVLLMLNDLFKMGLSVFELESYALILGSDCPFFITDKSVFAEGRGETFTNTEVDISRYYMVLANPQIHISTAEAYGGVVPQKRSKKLLEEVDVDIRKWKGIVENDFEISVFKKHIAISDLKQTMYNLGAVYAAMSGSGSTVYGIFEKEIDIPSNIPVIWKGIIG